MTRTVIRAQYSLAEVLPFGLPRPGHPVERAIADAVRTMCRDSRRGAV